MSFRSKRTFSMMSENTSSYESENAPTQKGMISDSSLLKESARTSFTPSQKKLMHPSSTFGCKRIYSTMSESTLQNRITKESCTLNKITPPSSMLSQKQQQCHASSTLSVKQPSPSSTIPKTNSASSKQIFGQTPYTTPASEKIPSAAYAEQNSGHIPSKAAAKQLSRQISTMTAAKQTSQQSSSTTVTKQASGQSPYMGFDKQTSGKIPPTTSLMNKGGTQAIKESLKPSNSPSNGATLQSKVTWGPFRPQTTRFSESSSSGSPTLLASSTLNSHPQTFKVFPPKDNLPNSSSMMHRSTDPHIETSQSSPSFTVGGMFGSPMQRRYSASPSSDADRQWSAYVEATLNKKFDLNGSKKTTTNSASTVSEVNHSVLQNEHTVSTTTSTMSKRVLDSSQKINQGREKEPLNHSCLMETTKRQQPEIRIDSAYSENEILDDLFSIEGGKRQQQELCDDILLNESNSLDELSSMETAEHRQHDPRNGAIQSPTRQMLRRNSKGAKSKKPKTLKRRRSHVPDWPEEIEYDEKEEVMTLDVEGRKELVSGSVQPRDVWNNPGVRYHVHFNQFNQPIRRGGSIFVRFLGDIARKERFCPVGVKNWHEIHERNKAGIINVVRSHFIILGGETFDKGILLRVNKTWRNHRFTLKTDYFDVVNKTLDQIYDGVPSGITRDNWQRLVTYWSSEDFKRLSELGKKARASQCHVHTSGATSFANIRADLKAEYEREPSELEVFKSTHAKEDGTFVEGTLTEQLVEVANAKVAEAIAKSPSKSRLEVENNVFGELIYEDETPKQPVNYGCGVKQSDIFGVQGILRREGCSTNNNSDLEVERLKVGLKMQDEHNRKMTNLFETVVTQMTQVLNAMRSGSATEELIDGADAVLQMAKANSQAPNS